MLDGQDVFLFFLKTKETFSFIANKPNHMFTTCICKFTFINKFDEVSFVMVTWASMFVLNYYFNNNWSLKFLLNFTTHWKIWLKIITHHCLPLDVISEALELVFDTMHSHNFCMYNIIPGSTFHDPLSTLIRHNSELQSHCTLEPH